MIRDAFQWQPQELGVQAQPEAPADSGDALVEDEPPFPVGAAKVEN